MYNLDFLWSQFIGSLFHLKISQNIVFFLKLIIKMSILSFNLFKKHITGKITWFYCVGKKKLFMHCLRTVYVLFTDLTILFTHLKIILLQCFQFSVSTTTNPIQTDPIIFRWHNNGNGAQSDTPLRYLGEMLVRNILIVFMLSQKHKNTIHQKKHKKTEENTNL